MLLDFVAPNLETLVSGRLLQQLPRHCVTRGLHHRNKTAAVADRYANFPGDHVGLAIAEERHTMPKPQRSQHLSEDGRMLRERA
jgi:hypothetical protein